MKIINRSFHGGRSPAMGSADTGDGKRYKHCYRCNEDIITDKFYPDVSQYDGIRSSCIECDSAYKKQYYIDNRDYILKERKQYYIENRERILERQRQYRLRKAAAARL